ncbi:nucleotide-diphospho-sugar transferase [Clavulina sp. PMI_390]|nr:nucleotide-diphospho-sugar transferase [Clavulina sp. PMI_390]
MASSSSSSSRRFNGAFVHLFTNDSYLPGLLVLHQSHLDVKSRYPFVVMVTDAVSQQARDLMTQLQMVLRSVEPLHPLETCHLDQTDVRFNDTWTKLRAFELYEYERVVLRDIDMLLQHNVDDLLESELPEDWIAASHVCACNPRRFPHYPDDWVPENCAYSALSYPSCLTSATPIHPSSPRPYGLLNSGVVVLTPSPENASNVSDFFHNSSSLISTFKFPDQDFLAELFRDRWQPLPWVHNALKSLRLIHPEIWRDDDARCIHYIMAEKPWLVARPPSDDDDLENELSRWWWAAFDKLESEYQHEPWWSLVDANVIGTAGARF